MRPVVVVLLLALAAGTAPAQWWQGPYQLTTDSASDINPSVCREWVLPDHTCMVWQTNRNGNWDVYSRFCGYYEGNGWGPEEPVTLSAADDINPAAASVNDAYDHPSYWCAWERAESPAMHTIRAAFITWRDQWWDTAVVANVPLNPGENAEPSAIVINDTAWVAWRGHDTDSYYIGCAFHNGTAWSQPGVAASSGMPLNHVRIGRATPPGQTWPYCPLLVWETQDNIFFSEYISGAWTSPVEVAPSAAVDRAPEIISLSLMVGIGPWIVWQSTRGGDTAIYGTTPDSAGVAHRWCNSAPCGANLGPSGVPVAFPTLDQGENAFAVWTTNRNGNPDIYSTAPFTGQGDIPVDINPALDSNPVITAMGATEVWCCWQSNRSGNWDLWGSFIYASDIAERKTVPPTRVALEVSPNPSRGNVHLRLTADGLRPEVRIFDQSGRLIRTLAIPHPASRIPHSIVWNGTDNSGQPVSEGCYFCVLRANDRVIQRKLMLTR